MPSRRQYSQAEDLNIINYIADNNLYYSVKGRSMWIRMEHSNVCPGRTWQSLRERFNKTIVDILPILNVPKDIEKQILNGYLKINRNIQDPSDEASDRSLNSKKDKRALHTKSSLQSERLDLSVAGSSENYDVSPSLFRSNRKRKQTILSEDNGNHSLQFTIKEDEKIIEFFKKNMKWVRLTYDEATYKMLQIDSSLKKTTRALRDRFVKHIVPNLYNYKQCLTSSEMVDFYDKLNIEVPQELQHMILKEMEKKNQSNNQIEVDCVQNNSNINTKTDLCEKHVDLNSINGEINITPEKCTQNTKNTSMNESVKNLPEVEISNCKQRSKKSSKSKKILKYVLNPKEDRCIIHSLDDFVGIRFEGEQHVFLSSNEKDLVNIMKKLKNEFNIVFDNIHIISREDYELLNSYKQLNEMFRNKIVSFIQKYVGNPNVIDYNLCSFENRIVENEVPESQRCLNTSGSGFCKEAIKEPASNMNEEELKIKEDKMSISSSDTFILENIDEIVDYFAGDEENEINLKQSPHTQISENNIEEESESVTTSGYTNVLNTISQTFNKKYHLSKKSREKLKN